MKFDTDHFTVLSLDIYVYKIYMLWFFFEIIFRKTVDFEFNFMDRAPLLQDCPELHHWFFTKMVHL